MSDSLRERLAQRQASDEQATTLRDRRLKPESEALMAMPNARVIELLREQKTRAEVATCSVRNLQEVGTATITSFTTDEAHQKWLPVIRSKEKGDMCAVDRSATGIR